MYYVEEGPGEGGKTLKVVQRPLYVEEPFGAGRGGLTVLPGILDLRWEYEGEGGWTGEWPGEEGGAGVPGRVRLTLSYRDSGTGGTERRIERVFNLLARPMEGKDQGKVMAGDEKSFAGK